MEEKGLTTMDRVAISRILKNAKSDELRILVVNARVELRNRRKMRR